MSLHWQDTELFLNWDIQRDFLRACFVDKELTLLEAALDLVFRFHDELRFDGMGNNRVHILRVARIVVEEMNIHSLDVVLIALLHDILEDTPVSSKEISNLFGEYVLSGVVLLTRPRDKDWKQYSDEIVARGDLNIIKVKIADKLDNARSHCLSKNEERRAVDYNKTVTIILPLVKEKCPELIPRFQEVLDIW
jgi:GTP diphosphokinase / guanosine-3',5'-bis(diphosphate) 3'-diphosphatase